MSYDLGLLIKSKFPTKPKAPRAKFVVRAKSSRHISLFADVSSCIEKQDVLSLSVGPLLFCGVYRPAASRHRCPASTTLPASSQCVLQLGSRDRRLSRRASRRRMRWQQRTYTSRRGVALRAGWHKHAVALKCRTSRSRGCVLTMCTRGTRPAKWASRLLLSTSHLGDLLSLVCLFVCFLCKDKKSLKPF